MAARDMDRARAAADQLSSEGRRVKCVYNDATKPKTFVTMVDEAAHDAGRIDVLVNNFGTSNRQKDLDFANTDPEVFLNTVTLNLRSVFLASQAAVRYMRKTGGGSIINISSVGGLVPDISQVSYGTSKAAINYLTKLIAVHEAKNNIRCNAVLPGMTATEAVEKHLSEEFRGISPSAGWDCQRRSLPRWYIWRATKPPIQPGKSWLFPVVLAWQRLYTVIFLTNRDSDYCLTTILKNP